MARSSRWLKLLRGKSRLVKKRNGKNGEPKEGRNEKPESGKNNSRKSYNRQG
jgi:hypothetical protein